MNSLLKTGLDSAIDYFIWPTFIPSVSFTYRISLLMGVVPLTSRAKPRKKTKTKNARTSLFPRSRNKNNRLFINPKHSETSKSPWHLNVKISAKTEQNWANDDRFEQVQTCASYDGTRTDRRMDVDTHKKPTHVVRRWHRVFGNEEPSIFWELTIIFWVASTKLQPKLLSEISQ